MSKPPVNPNSITRIASGTTITTSKVTSVCDIRIDGDFVGDISSTARVVLGETAHMKGKIICEFLDIWGELDGDVLVKDLISIKSSGTYNGDIKSGNLEVEMGAVLLGRNQKITVDEFLQEASQDEFLKANVEIPVKK